MQGYNYTSSIKKLFHFKLTSSRIVGEIEEDLINQMAFEGASVSTNEVN